MKNVAHLISILCKEVQAIKMLNIKKWSPSGKSSAIVFPILSGHL